MQTSEIVRLQQYLRDKLGTDRISLRIREKSEDSVEVHLADEFIGVIYRDEDEGEISYAFHMTILEMDLPEDFR